MEHCFRTALWIFVLIGCLQAAPTKRDYRFTLLQRVTCHGNVTFKSPKIASDSCLAAAVETIREGLQQARDNCPCEICKKVINTLGEVEVPPPAQNCSTDQVGSLTFDKFLEEFEAVIEKITSEQNN